MKKLLLIAVSFLSLAIIFAAGWASGVGRLKDRDKQPVSLTEDPVDEECPDEPKCHECPDNEDNTDLNRMHGRKFRIPLPPVTRDGHELKPKTLN